MSPFASRQFVSRRSSKRLERQPCSLAAVYLLYSPEESGFHSRCLLLGNLPRRPCTGRRIGVLKAAAQSSQSLSSLAVVEVVSPKAELVERLGEGSCGSGPRPRPTQRSCRAPGPTEPCRGRSCSTSWTPSPPSPTPSPPWPPSPSPWRRAQRATAGRATAAFALTVAGVELLATTARWSTPRSSPFGRPSSSFGAPRRSGWARRARRASFASAFIASIFDSYASFFASASAVFASALAELRLGLRPWRASPRGRPAPPPRASPRARFRTSRFDDDALAAGSRRVSAGRTGTPRAVAAEQRSSTPICFHRALRD